MLINSIIRNADKLKISLMIIHLNSEIEPTGENRMSHEDYMLILGKNVYANPEYTVSYEVDKDTPDRINLFTLENRENGLILTTEIRDEHANLIAKIDKNEVTQVNEKFDVEGEIETGPGFTLTGKEDGTVIFNARITEDGYVAVTGLFYIGGKKIHISDDTVKIDDVTRQTIKGMNIHDNFFVGIGDITITDDGLKFYTPDDCNPHHCNL